MRYSNTPTPTPLTFEKFPSSSRRIAVVTFAAAVASSLRNHAANGLEPARSRYSRTVKVYMVTQTLPSSKGRNKSKSITVPSEEAFVRETHSPLHHRVAARRFTEPLRAQLRCTLLRLEIHVDQSEAVAVAVDPLEVVLGTPQEVPAHWHTVGGGTPQLREVRAQEHDSVGVIHPAIVGNG